MVKKIVLFIIVISLFHFFHCDLEGKRFVRNRVVVKMNGNTAAGATDWSSTKTPLAERPGYLLLHKYNSSLTAMQWNREGNYYIFETVDGCDIEALSGRLRQDPFVSDVSPDYYAVFAGSPPNDPYFQYQYGLDNSGQVYVPGYDFRGTPGSDIKALEGWDWTPGSEDVVIAVIDSGVALDHEDLKNKIVAGYNFVAVNDNPYDDHGHGTFAASIAAAETNNGVGVAGVSWYSRIMPIKVMDTEGYGAYTYIAAGIRWAADHGARVLNLSVGGQDPSFILEDACAYAFGKGVVLVAASGNYSSPHVLYPAAYNDYCLAVAATDADDIRPSWSNYGPSVDVAAPGCAVCGAFFNPRDPGNLNTYGWNNGTSFACPMVAGAAALLLAYKPFLSNSQVMDLIKFTADDVNWETYPGVDDYIGYGRINLQRLLEPYSLQ